MINHKLKSLSFIALLTVVALPLGDVAYAEGGAPGSSPSASEASRPAAGAEVSAPAAATDNRHETPVVEEVKGDESTTSHDTNSPGTTSHDTDTLDEVRTIAKKGEQLLNSLVTISGKELVDENITSVADALLLIPGAAPDYGLTAVKRISIDGLSPGRVTVMRDGVPLGRITGHPRGSAADYGQHTFDPEEIERMEITRGLGPNGSNGIVVNLISKHKDQFEATITGRYGHSDQGNVDDKGNFSILGGSYRREVAGNLSLPIASLLKNSDDHPFLKDLSVSGSLGYSNINGVRFKKLKKDPAKNISFDWDSKTNPGIKNLYGDLQFGWANRGDYLVASLNVDSTKVNVDYPVLEEVTNTQQYIGQIRGKWNYSFGYLTHSMSFNQFLLDYNKYVKVKKSEAPISQTDSKTFNQSVDAVFLVGNHDITFSGSFNRESLIRKGSSGQVDGNTLSKLTFGVGEHWYINKEWDVEAQLRGITFATEGRGDQYNFDGLVRAAWKPNQHYLARITAARAVQAPTLEQLHIGFPKIATPYKFMLVPDKDLAPEVMHTIKGEFGARYHWVAMTFSPFFHYINNYIKPVPVPKGPGIPELSITNAGTVIASGFNIIAELNLPYGLNIAGNYTYLPLSKYYSNKATKTVSNDKESFYKKDRTPFRPLHSYHLEINGRWLDQTLGARAWVDGRAELLVENYAVVAKKRVRYTDYIPSVLELNAAVSYSPYKWMTVGLEGHNLLNEVNPVWGPTVGRYFMATLTLRQQGL